MGKRRESEEERRERREEEKGSKRRGREEEKAKRRREGKRRGITVEPPKTDSPYYGNLHNADKSPRSRIIPYTIVYVHKETSLLRTPPK